MKEVKRLCWVIPVIWDCGKDKIIEKTETPVVTWVCCQWKCTAQRISSVVKMLVATASVCMCPQSVMWSWWCFGRRLDCEGLILTRGLVPQMNLELNVILGFKGWSEECVTGVMDGHVMSSLSSAIPLSPAIWLWSLWAMTKTSTNWGSVNLSSSELCVSQWWRSD